MPLSTLVLATPLAALSVGGEAADSAELLHFLPRYIGGKEQEMGDSMALPLQHGGQHRCAGVLGEIYCPGIDPVQFTPSLEQ